MSEIWTRIGKRAGIAIAKEIETEIGIETGGGVAHEIDTADVGLTVAIVIVVVTIDLGPAQDQESDIADRKAAKAGVAGVAHGSVDLIESAGRAMLRKKAITTISRGEERSKSKSTRIKRLWLMVLETVSMNENFHWLIFA